MVKRRDYDADIKPKDITSCYDNAILLRKIRDGDPFLNERLYIVNEEDEEDDGFVEKFFVAEGDNLGWLGYFVGKSEVIEDLHINCYFPEGGEDDFYEGMSQNRSIKILKVSIDIGVDGWSRLGSFLENNDNLASFKVEDFTMVHESAQNLASALGRMNHNRFEHLSMASSGIGDEGLAEIATALRLQSQLKCLELNHNNIGRDGCIALGNTLSRWPHSNKLESLSLGNNSIDDVGLQALVSGLMNCCSLKKLYLESNRSITGDGLRSLSPLLQSESHSLETLNVSRINFGHDGAMALAEGLRGNTFLKNLVFDVETAGITNIGWSAFSTLLCDTSTINSTYLSNHTLTRLGCYNNEGIPQHISTHLALNKYRDAAICKILCSHPDLDMEPFFEWKMKFLPVAISWLQRAQSSRLGTESNQKSASRKLSALYKFVRAMPDLTTIGYWEGRMIHIEAEKRRLEYEEEITRERLGLGLSEPMDVPRRNKRMRLK